MAAEGDVLSEIEVLQSIYLDELQVQKDDGGWRVSLVLYPSTAEDSVSQFVRLTLTLTLDSQYPSSPPSISIHNPRGLSDDKLGSVRDCLKMEAESSLGSPVLYQLIEKAKEILTESNIPHGNCVICLYGFKEGEAFTKTSCYHYFHSHCLGRYITHSETELRERERELEEDKTREGLEDDLTVVCPVCREALTYDVNKLLMSPAPSFPKLEGAMIGAEFRQKWREFQKLLERQKAKGGIIDPEAESNRFLIHINEPPPDAENGSTEVDVSPSQSLPSLPTAATPTVRAPQDQTHTGHSHRRYGPGCGHRRQPHSKGSRRGGGGRPPHGKPVHPTEHLDKLTLSSKKQDHFQHAPAPCDDGDSVSRRNHDIPKPVSQPNLDIPKPVSQPNLDIQKPVSQPNLDIPKPVSQPNLDIPKPVSQPNLDIPKPVSQPNLDIPKPLSQRDAPDSERGRGNRGRRRGPRSSAQHPGQWQDRHWRGTDQWDAPGSMYHRWDERGQRSEGGANNLHSRGGRARRGNGKVCHPRVVEGQVGREGVL